MMKISSPITYGSKAHSSLCYAMMRRGCFSADEMRLCLSGVFGNQSRSLNEAKRACMHLSKYSLVDKCPADGWVITDAGKEMLYVAAHNHRQYKEKILGKRMLHNLHRKIDKEPRTLQYSMGFLDKEDKIIEEINKKIKSLSKQKK